MGKLDTEMKDYMKNPRRVADAINYVLYNGEKVVRPENLSELDTTLVAVPYGEGNAKEPVQKYRDNLTLMRCGDVIYAIVGIENESKVHQAMPPRTMLYDALNYVKQVREAASSHNDKADYGESAEFLSGFHKDDRLIPVITLVIYFGRKKWDAPRSLREMFCTDDPVILKYAQDYKINLIVPSEIPREKFGNFISDLGIVFKYILASHNNKKLNALLRDQHSQLIEKDAFDVVNDVGNLKLKPVVKEGRVDMNQAIEEMKAEAVRKAINKEKKTAARNAEKAAKEAAKETEKAVNERVATEMLREGIKVGVISRVSTLSIKRIKEIAAMIGAAVVL